MGAPRVEKVEVPAGSLAEGAGFTDYADAYRIDVDDRFPDVESFARAMLGRAPRAVSALMGIRDRVVGLFGLKRSIDAPATPSDRPLAVGDQAGIFRVFALRPGEMLLGEDDRHLDFRVSILRTEDDAGAHVTMSTVVRFHNALGRAYFVPVAPVHRRIVPAMLRAALRS